MVQHYVPDDLDRELARLEERDRRNGSGRNEPKPAKDPAPASHAVMRRVADVERERVAWLWPARIPLGKLTVLDGDPGLGKSTVAGADLAARVSTGSPLPDGHRPDGPADVVLLSAEDGVADTIRPRLEAAGADLERVHVLDAVVTQEHPLGRPWSLPGDLEVLRQAITTTGAVMAVIDPLMAFLHSSVNSYRDQDVRGAMAPLAKLAEETGAAIILVRHLNKAAGGPAIYRGGGSIGIVGAVRSGLLVAADPDDETRRVLAVVKSNLAPIPPSLAYHLVPDEEHGCARVEWDGESAHSAASLVAIPASDEERGELADACGFLRDLLAAGPVAAKKVESEARSAGISPATLRRAKARLKVASHKSGLDQGWVWELPPEGAHEGAQRSTHEHLEHLEHLRPDQGLCSPEDAHSPEGAQGGGNEHLQHLQSGGGADNHRFDPDGDVGDLDPATLDRLQVLLPEDEAPVLTDDDLDRLDGGEIADNLEETDEDPLSEHQAAAMLLDAFPGTVVLDETEVV